MNEPFAGPGGAAESGASGVSTNALTAGAILRAARERQGVHIAMLAAAIKVSPRKLDALEGDRYDELPDATFTRALAQTVCRALKIDVQPVLAKLPLAGTAPLEQVSVGLGTPFRERPGRGELSTRLPPMPLVWAGVALVAAAVAIALWPAQGLEGLGIGGPDKTAATTAAPAPVAVESPASAAAVPDVTASPVAPAPAAAPGAAPLIETVHSAPPPDPAAPATARGATLTAADASWVEIVDGSGQTLLSRIVQAGETVNVDGALPMKLKIGNARSTQLVFRGQAVELDAFTRDNIARVELK